jgi:hypothetical protein
MAGEESAKILLEIQHPHMFWEGSLHQGPSRGIEPRRDEMREEPSGSSSHGRARLLSGKVRNNQPVIEAAAGRPGGESVVASAMTDSRRTITFFEAAAPIVIGIWGHQPPPSYLKKDSWFSRIIQS